MELSVAIDRITSSHILFINKIFHEMILSTATDDSILSLNLDY